MKNTKIKGVKTLSKTDQKLVLAGDHPICCYKACVNSGYLPKLCKNVCFS